MEEGRRVVEINPGTLSGGLGKVGVRCPYHEEKTPSCVICFETKVIGESIGWFHCFSCQCKGPAQGKPTLDGMMLVRLDDYSEVDR